MRVPLVMRCFVRAVFVCTGSGLIGAVPASPQTPPPPEPPEKRNAVRLGFRFDQRAHDAAAKTENAASIFLDPPDADVLRLPNYRVTEDRVDLEEHRVLAPRGRVELAKKRYLAPMYQKTAGHLMALPSFLNNPLGGWSPNAPEAMAIYNDFENLRRKKEMAELTELARFADKATNPKAKKVRGKQKRSKQR